MRILPTFSLLLVLGTSAGCVSPSDLDDGDVVAESADEIRALKTAEIVGDIAYGESTSVLYTRTPYYRALRFQGKGGDAVSAKISSAVGDPVGWLVTGSFQNLVYVAGKAGQKAIDVKATLPADGTYYVVFRERTRKKSTLDVALSATSAAPTGVIPPEDVNLAGKLEYGAERRVAYSDHSGPFMGLEVRAIAGDRLDVLLRGPESVLHLLDKSGKVLASGLASPSGASFETTAPATGTYLIAFGHEYQEKASYELGLNREPYRAGVDPFEATSCGGAPMNNADIAARLPSPAAQPGQTFSLGTWAARKRSRTCTGAGCGAWGEPSYEIFSSGALGTTPTRLEGKTVIERKSDGGVAVSFQFPGCYNSPDGLECRADQSGALSCGGLRWNRRVQRYNGTYCEQQPSPAPAFSGFVGTHCARAVGRSRDHRNIETEYVLLTHF
jgi:hypothetical protein